MTWSMPAKTFLLGEYLALSGQPAILLCTKPLFTLSLSEINDGSIHPHAPASQYWHQANQSAHFLSFSDPYAGRGGFGASSAQFLGAYLELSQRQGITPSFTGLIEAYDGMSEAGGGMRPSGYDVIAQASSSCVYIHKNQQEVDVWPWPFEDISFVLFHTGQKLATHEHLTALPPMTSYDDLIAQLYLARAAFLQSDAAAIVRAVNAYYHALVAYGLQALHTQQFVSELMQLPGVLAAKGCGAMGSDVILVLADKFAVSGLCFKAQALGLVKMATTLDLYQDLALIQKF